MRDESPEEQAVSALAKRMLELRSPETRPITKRVPRDPWPDGYCPDCGASWCRYREVQATDRREY